MKCLLVSLPDTHCLANRTHLSAKLVLNSLKFLKSPAGKFHNNILTPRLIFIKRTASPIGNFIQSQPSRQHRRYQRYRKARSLRSQSRRPRCTRINFDHYHLAAFRVMCKLNIRPADNTNSLNYSIGIFLELFLQFLRYSQHRCRTERIAGMNTHRIHVLNKTYCDLLSLSVTNNFQLQLFPPKHRFLNKYLVNHTRCKPPRCYCPELLDIISKPSTSAAHRISRPDNNWETHLFNYFLCPLKSISSLTFSRLDTKRIHRLLKFYPVFASFDRIQLNTNNLYVILVQYSRFSKFTRKVKSTLSA